MSQPGVLNVIGGNDRGKQFPLTIAETRIGRGTDQDVVLSDIAVSRRHFTIVMEGLRYRVKDLGSGNGTLVNGQKVASHVLIDGDVIEIGQTVMRFDHALSRGVAQASPNMPTMGAMPAPVLPPPAAPMAMPPPSAMPPRPQTFSQPVVAPAPRSAFPVETPSDAVSIPTGMPMRAAPNYTGQTTGPNWLSSLMETPLKQALVFGAMGVLCVIAVITILARTVFAKPPVVQSEAEELYKQGLKTFGSGDYEGAKVIFSEAQKMAPDSTDVTRYLGLCDLEIHSKGVLKNAERALAGRHYAEAIKALDSIDANSIQYDQAMHTRKLNAPRAAAEEVDEARRMASDDPDGAKAAITRALELDPGNDDARQLAAKLRGGAPIASKEEDQQPPPEKQVAHNTPPPPHHVKEKDDGLAPIKVKPGKTDAPAATGGGGSLGGAALAAYKNKDFVAAERTVRGEAMKQDGKAMQKTIELANQVKNFKTLLDKAAGEETKSPDAAIKDYNDAIAQDGHLGKGALGPFLKQKVGKMEVASAQAAFNAGKYDQAFQTVTAAQRHGATDGGALLKSLEGKAAELVQKGLGLQKSNLNQAKTYWRMVVHMVPTSSPSYSKAYGLLNQAGPAHKDEDEN